MIIELIYNFLKFLWKIVSLSDLLHHGLGQNVLKASCVFTMPVMHDSHTHDEDRKGLQTLAFSSSTMLRRFS